MMRVDDSIKNDLEFWISQKVLNRAEIGICAFSTKEGVLNSSSNVFTYEKCVAVAALMTRGYDEIDAATLVAHDIVYASPYHPARGIESPEGSDPVGVGVVGIYRLADGSLWSVLADNDIGCVKPADLSRDYVVLATRGTSVVDESPADRVKESLTRCDELGQYLAAA